MRGKIYENLLAPLPQAEFVVRVKCEKLREQEAPRYVPGRRRRQAASPRPVHPEGMRLRGGVVVCEAVHQAQAFPEDDPGCRVPCGDSVSESELEKVADRNAKVFNPGPFDCVFPGVGPEAL